MRPIGVMILVVLLAALVYSQREMFIKGLADEVKKELADAPPDSSAQAVAAVDSAAQEEEGPPLDALVKEGERLFEGRDLDGASAAFRQALARNPDDPRPYAHLGLICTDRKDFEGALAVEEQAVERAPEQAGYRVNLGKAYAQLGRREEALAQWKKVLELDPYNDTAQELIQKEESGVEKQSLDEDL